MLSEKKPSVLVDELQHTHCHGALGVAFDVLDELHATVTEHARALAALTTVRSMDATSDQAIRDDQVRYDVHYWHDKWRDCHRALTAEQSAHEETRDRLKDAEENLRIRLDVCEHATHEFARLHDEASAREATIAQLTRERDEARSERDAVAEILGRSNDVNGKLLADRDRLQGELEKQGAKLEQTRVQLAGCGCAALGYDEGCKPGDYGWSASFGDVLRLHQETEALRAQSGEGPLRETLWRFSRQLETYDEWSGCEKVGEELRRILAAHPAPTSADGDRVAPGGERGLSRYGYTNVHVGSHEFRMLPDTPVVIGAHTLTVSEWEGLAKERGRADMLSLTNDALRVRVEKAASALGGFKGIMVPAGSASLFYDAVERLLSEVVATLTSEQPPGEGNSTEATGDIPKPGHTSESDTTEADWCVPPGTEDTAFARPFGTIRKCHGCDALVAGGPTRCARCAEEQPPTKNCHAQVSPESAAAIADITTAAIGRLATPDLVERVCGYSRDDETAYITDGSGDDLALSVDDGELRVCVREDDENCLAILTRDQVRDTLIPLLARFVDTGAIRIVRDEATK